MKPYQRQELLPTQPLSEEELGELGVGPLAPKAKTREPIQRQPHDELYVKLKQQRDYWNRN